MNTNISDELLARYIAGQTTAEENDTILDHLSESDERLADFANMCGGLERYYQQQQTVSRNKKRTLFYKNRTAYWSAAAAVAAVLIVVGVLWINPATTEGPLVAENTITNNSTIVPTQPSVTNTAPTATATPSSTSTPIKASDLTKEPSVQLHRQEHVTASQSAVELVFDVLSPRRSRDASPQGSPIVFKWSCNASQLHFTATDETGATIINADVTHRQSYTLTPDMLDEVLKLHWTLRAVFDDGTSMRKEGTIAIE